MSANLEAYGYQEMPKEEVAKEDLTVDSKVTTLLRKGKYKPFDEIYWKNENMNIFDAMRFVNYAYQVKQQHDFRPGGFMINYRLVKPMHVTERLKLTFEEHEKLMNFDISKYIYKKLS
jgi:hypothetical protein